MNYPHLLARIFNTPLLIHPQQLDAMIAGIGPRLLGNTPEAGAILTALAQARSHHAAAPDMFSTRPNTKADYERGYQVDQGVAVLYASGPLVHRSRFDNATCARIQGYDTLTATQEHALGNPEVHAIVRVMDTPGGEVQGAFEHRDRLMDMKGKKPIIAIADGLAASAGYLSALGADEIAITTTGYVGSIGVVMRHVDFSAAMEADGIKVTHIFAGAHKVDGNPFEPLPDTVRDDMQAEINSLYELFVAAVAESRNLTPAAVKKTQAQIYRGPAAIAAGLADRIATTDQLITELAGLRARSYPVGQPARTTATVIQQEKSMEDTLNPTGQITAPVPQASQGYTQADLDKARAEGHAAGVSAENARITGILAHDGANAHPALAQQCITSGLTADQSAAILGAAPQPIQAASVNQFAAAMSALGNPAVSGVEGQGSGTEDPEAQAAASILAAAGIK